MNAPDLQALSDRLDAEVEADINEIPAIRARVVEAIHKAKTPAALAALVRALCALDAQYATPKDGGLLAEIEKMKQVMGAMRELGMPTAAPPPAPARKTVVAGAQPAMAPFVPEPPMTEEEMLSARRVTVDEPKRRTVVPGKVNRTLTAETSEGKANVGISFG